MVAFGNWGSGDYMLIIIDGPAVYIQSDTYPSNVEWREALDAAGLTGRSCMLVEYDDSTNGHEWVFALRDTSVAVSA